MHVLTAHLCFSKLSWARRLNASAATVLSRRGAVMPHGQSGQHQPVKSSPSTQINRLFIHLPLLLASGLELGRRGVEHINERAREDPFPSPRVISHGISNKPSN